METKVQAGINEFWSVVAFPFVLLPSFKELGIGGLGFLGYGCAGGSQKPFGLVAVEIARADAPVCTFWGGHNRPPMGPVYLARSERPKEKTLPPKPRLEENGGCGVRRT